MLHPNNTNIYETLHRKKTILLHSEVVLAGRWESRIGIPGSKHIYLGLYKEEQEAARAYDQALVRLRGASASTNFALSDYRQELADYHRMQQAVLMADESWSEYMNSGTSLLSNVELLLLC